LLHLVLDLEKSGFALFIEKRLVEGYEKTGLAFLKKDQRSIPYFYRNTFSLSFIIIAIKLKTSFSFIRLSFYL
jgi:hypothetical protein